MIVIFHSSDGKNHCDDGFAAAWIFWRKFQNEPRLSFRPGIYGTSPDLRDAQEGEIVALVDFSYKREQMKLLALSPIQLLVLDHHKTAKEALDGLVDEILRETDWPEDGFGQYLGLPDIRFDQEKSGATMAWSYCFPDEEPPDLILRIEDNDLWRTPRRYDDSVYVQAALRSYPQDFETWDHLMAMPIEDLAAEGIAIRRFIEAKVVELKRTSWRTQIGGVEMPVCNAPWFLASELAGALAEDDPDGRGAVYFEQEHRIVFSLRARGDAEVESIAKARGGGGHAQAAGFEVRRWAEVASELAARGRD